MKRDIKTIILFVSILTTLFICTPFSCLNEKKILRKNQALPKAYWNQEEHDRAVHSIHQPRDMKVHISIHTGETTSAGTMLKLYTGNEKYGSDNEYNEIVVDKNMIIDHELHYNHSYIGIEVNPPLIPSQHGIDTVLFSWYRPGKWIEAMKINIDISQMYCIIYPPVKNGIIKSEIMYQPDWKEKKVWVNFENLYAITSSPGMHPRGLQAQEAHIIRGIEGKLTIILDMPGFFKKWYKNFSKPWKQGDTFIVTLSLTLVPPGDLFTITDSDKKDKPFVPKVYNGKVDASEGDPYLFIPSTEPVEEVIVKSTIKIPVTTEMIEF